MNKAYASTLTAAKNSGIRDGIDACTRVMSVAFYNAMCDCLPDLADKDKGIVFTAMRTEMLEILAQGRSDTYTDEISHAVHTAMAKMEVAKL